MRDQTRTTEGNVMKAVAFLVRLLAYVNERLLLVGRGVGIAAVAVMVIVTILQVFCRYVLDNALAWPDEAARFCMLWMAGLMAPTAYRRGGFVAIDTIPALMPRRLAEVLSLALLTLSLVVLVYCVQIGWKETTGLGGKFALASINLPTSITFDTWMRVPRSWMMASLSVGVTLLTLVNFELILRAFLRIFDADRDLPLIALAPNTGAE